LQDRYVGDIGDYFKYGMLRRLAKGRSLGVMWYLFPDENHNDDGKHTSYLERPDNWRNFDPALFDTLEQLALDNRRNTAALAQSGILGNTKFNFERLDAGWLKVNERRRWRGAWFENGLTFLKTCDLIFADPDNGLCDDRAFSEGSVKDWKRIPLSEAKALAKERTAIIYHHNSRFKGGHEQEVMHWIQKLGKETFALRWRAYSSRTFFILNPSPEIVSSAKQIADDWGPKAEFFDSGGRVI